MRQESPRLGTSLAHGRLVALGPEGVRLAFAPDARFHRACVFGQSRPQLEDVLSRSLGFAARLVEETSAAAFGAAPLSFAEADAAARQTHERDVEALVRTHPAVRAVTRLLGGSVEHVRVLDRAPADAPVASAHDDDE